MRQITQDFGVSCKPRPHFGPHFACALADLLGILWSFVSFGGTQITATPWPLQVANRTAIDPLLFARRHRRTDPWSRRSLFVRSKDELPKLGVDLSGGAALQHLNTLFADRLNNASKHFNRSPKPGEILRRDAIVLRVAGLHIGVLELFE